MAETDPSQRDMEHNVILRFSRAFEARFPTSAPNELIPGWANTSLGAQDNIFADHLLAANARFALIEFKANFLAIRTEAKKPLRQKLFHLLAMRSDFLRRCLDFHFVCWGTTHRHQPPGFATPIVEEIDLLNRYAVHVAPFMDTALEVCDSADINTQAFLDNFLGSRLMGGTYERFKRYVDELGRLAGQGKGDASTIEGMVCVYLPGDRRTPARYAHSRFQGLDALQLMLMPRIRDKAYEHKRTQGIAREPRDGPTLG